jgi:hypothetical protein
MIVMAIWDKVKKKVEEQKQELPPVMKIPEVPSVEPIKIERPELRYESPPRDKRVMPEKDDCIIQLEYLNKQLDTLAKERENLDGLINRILVLKRMYDYALAYHNNDRIFFPQGQENAGQTN